MTTYQRVEKIIDIFTDRFPGVYTVLHDDKEICEEIRDEITQIVTD